MSDVFDQMRQGAAAPEPQESSQTTEIHKYVITDAAKSGDVVLDQSVVERVDPDGVVREHLHTVIRADCCGHLCCYDSDTRHKPPAARCPSCGATVCYRCAETRLSCSLCAATKVLCLACAKVIGDLAFCHECFAKVAKLNEERVMQCLASTPDRKRC